MQIYLKNQTSKLRQLFSSSQHSLHHILSVPLTHPSKPTSSSNTTIAHSPTTLHHYYEGVSSTMAQGYFKPSCSETGCLNGAHYTTCPDCGGLYRKVQDCKRCEFTGMVATACPYYIPYPSTGVAGSSNDAAYSGSTGFSTGGNWQGPGQQGYGNTARR